VDSQTTDCQKIELHARRWLSLIDQEIEMLRQQRDLLDLKMTLLFQHKEHLLDALLDLKEQGGVISTCN
jgi:hypothetical protein